MKIFLTLMVAMPIMAFAQSRQGLEDNVRNSLRDARESITRNMQKMTERELIKTNRLLQEVAAIAAGDVATPMPLPRPVPVPAPIPQRPRFEVMCSQDQTEIFQSAFVVIKDLAYSGTGLNMTSSQAVAFAEEWTRSNPCRRANAYSTDLRRLRNFAYSGTGLNMTSTAANQYALSMIDRVCSNVNYEAIYSKHYTFAYSGTGMNMTSSQAVAYARPKVEAEAFYCDNTQNR